MAKAMPFCHACARDSNRPVWDCSGASARVMALLHQSHNRVGQINLGVERLAHSHAVKPLKNAAEGLARTSAP